MKYHVHVKNEAGRDDNIDVEADSEIEAEVLAMALQPTAVAAVGAYPAWAPAAEQARDGWAR